MNFLEKLGASIRQRQSLLCVGLDPDVSRLPVALANFDSPAQAVTRFCREIIEATAPYACAYKPNLAFFEVLGPEGLAALREVVQAIPADIPVLADAKRGDIGNTARFYAATLFETYGFDAATVNPYLGYDSVAPFLAYKEKGIFLLCRTSNPGAVDFQDLLVTLGDAPPQPLYEVVARRILEWNVAGNCALVAGATYPQELQRLRALCPTLPILVPGVGAQGAALAETVTAGIDAEGERTLIALSRPILYAENAGHNYASAAGVAAQQLRDQINEARKKTQA